MWEAHKVHRACVILFPWSQGVALWPIELLHTQSVASQGGLCQQFTDFYWVFIM